MIKVNGKEIIFEKFPNGETLLKHSFKEVSKNMVSVEFKYESDEDLIRLMFIKKELDYFGAKYIGLIIRYMPYSRMDRRGSEEIAFTLKYICDFIKSLSFDIINIFEPHSDVCVNMLGAYNSFYTPDLLNENLEEIKPDFIMFPDGGALKRYGAMFKKFNIPIIHANKKRDFETGKILDLEIVGDIKEGNNVVIVDDLCCGGFTFKLSAEALKKKGAGNIYLIVGHCENTILERGLLEDKNIKKVFTTNSIINKDKETNKIKIKGEDSK